jgi:Mg2+ and Co2+ transporter CorA
MASPIPHNWDVPQVFRDRFGTRAGRQRVMHADGHVLIVLHDLPNADDPDTLDAKVYWRKPDGTWKSQGSSATTIAAMRAHVETFVAAIDALEHKAAKATRAKDWFEIMHHAAPLHRMVRNQAAALAEARDVAKGDKDLIAVRDTAQENERSIELINHHARAGLDYTIASNAEASAKGTEHVIESQHRLNLIAATFLPITAISALLGMNLDHGLASYKGPYVFWVVAAGAFLLGLFVRASLPAKKKSDD